MEIFEAISYIRSSKKLDVVETTGNTFSKSSYYRFISGKSDIYSKNFLEILNNLHISLNEVYSICDNHPENIQQHLLERIKISFEKNDLKELEYLQNYCNDEYQVTFNSTFLHYSSLIDILLSRLQKKVIDIKDNLLYKYLINVETWMNYEITLFNNSMFCFDIDIVKQVLPRAIKKLYFYNKSDQSNNKHIQLVANAIVFFIKEGEYIEAIKYIDMMEQIKLREENTFDRLVVSYFMALKKILMKDSKGFDEINHCLEIMKYLSMTNLLTMFEKLTEDLKKQFF